MSIEIKSEQAQQFLQQVLIEELVVIYGRLGSIRPSDQRLEDIITTLARGGKDLVVGSRNRHLGELFVYGLGHEGALRLGITTLAGIRSPENHFNYSATLGDEAGGREDWQLYAPAAPLPKMLFPKLEIPEIEDALISSMYLTLNSAGDRGRSRVINSWEVVLNNTATLPYFPHSLAQRMRRVLPD